MWDDDTSPKQWEALADADMNGIINNNDISNTYLTTWKPPVTEEASIPRSKFTTEVQSACSLLDGDGFILKIDEYTRWKEEVEN